MKPVMRVVKLQHQHIICGSTKGFTKGVTSNDGIGWKDNGFEDEDKDY